jgi:hypothetical protein
MPSNLTSKLFVVFLIQDPIYKFCSTLRVADPDSHSNCGSGSRRAKMTHKNRKSTEFSCFEVLDVLFRGLKASPLAWASFMEA